MKIEKSYLEYAALFLALTVLFWSLFSLVNFDSGHTDAKYNNAISSELPDKCKTPAGYTDAEWREHMGHHPDRYTECL